MKGHIRERSPGRWAIVIDVETAGKRKRKWHSFKGTKRAAQEECAMLIAAMKKGTYVEPRKLRLDEYLDKWLAHIKPNVSPRTYERYEELMGKNLAPLLGAVLVTKLQPMQISEAYAAASTSGRRDGRSIRPHRAAHASRSEPSSQAGGPLEPARFQSVRTSDENGSSQVGSQTGCNNRRRRHGQGNRRGAQSSFAHSPTARLVLRSAEGRDFGAEVEIRRP
jgi:hypothetical protein